MATLGSLQLGQVLGLEGLHLKPRNIRRARIQSVQFQLVGEKKFQGAAASRLGKSLLQDPWCLQLWANVHVRSVTRQRPASVPCSSLGLSIPGLPVQVKDVSLAFVRGISLLVARTFVLLKAYPVVVQTVPAVALIAFSIWGLAPVVRRLRKVFFKKNEKSWENSLTQQMVASYMRPIVLWIGVMIICRAVDPLVLSTEASHAIKQRFVNFVRSLSTVLAFAFCTASLTQQVQKFMLDRQDSQEARNVGVQFIGNTVYTSVWVAAVCLFMELLGFSTQKWITAGGFGTVLLTLAGREIFTNFLSSVMIHATRPFVESEWIQTKIEGQEVSGTVEHVGWWSPTVIRGDDREAVHIPNHKFTVSVVRNLSQKSHWRIKTHFGISHLDVNKIKHIVADMRKVLAKHPSVEQQRLHRRVFFDNIDPENQALLILVSCFVKTPHFEEYLRVKEVILLDLLKVISHHGARLATPIRSVQRILDENETRQAPFRDVTARSENHRPFLLVEAAAINDSDKELVRVKADSAETIGDRPGSAKVHVKVASSVNQVTEDITDLVSKLELEEKATGSTETKGTELKEKVVNASESKISSDADVTTKPHLVGLDSIGLNPGDMTQTGAALEQSNARIPEGTPDAGVQGDDAPEEKVSGKVSGERTVAKVPIDKDRAKSISDKVVPKVAIEQLAVRAGSKAGKSSQRISGVVSEQNSDASTLSTEKGGSNVSVGEGEPSVDESRKLTGERALPVAAHQVTSGEVNLHNTSRRETTSVEGDTGKDPWRDQNQAPSCVTSEAEKQDSTLSHVRSTADLSDERVPLQKPQTWEENVLLGVSIDGPKRSLRLEDELPLPSEQKSQPAVVPSNPRPQMAEDVLILGVALDGSQVTLHLGEDKSSAEQRELVTPRNANGSP